jgi:hypothetical protein
MGGCVFGVEAAEEIPVSGEVLAISSACAFHSTVPMYNLARCGNVNLQRAVELVNFRHFEV